MAEAISIKAIKQEFVARYGGNSAEVRVVVAPYRICPLGAHVDHQLGPVTAMAIDRAVYLAFAPSQNREIRLNSLSFPGEVHFSIDDVPDKQPGDWGNYVRGAVRALLKKNPLQQGILGVTTGSLSEGGLSSSAAFGVACLLALEKVNDLDISGTENILLDQKIENEYLGLRNGILDQAAILLSRRDQLTWIDCRTQQHELLEAGKNMPPFTILLAFSGLTKSLVSTDYNRRVEECATAARVLLTAAGRPDTMSQLGNVSPDEYNQYQYLLHGAESRRAKHFFTEIARVQQGIEAWRASDLVKFGQLMTESCASSIHNYECGAPPLVVLYELLISMPGVFGARFSGAGFRGCCVALVDRPKAQQIAEEIEKQYKQRVPELAQNARVLLCESDDGARIV